MTSSPDPQSSFAPESAPPEPVAARYELIGHRSAAESAQLYRLSLLLVGASGVYFGATAETEDVLHLYLGLAIYFVALWPGLQWVKEGGSRFPIFEPMMALCANAYALPVLSGHRMLSYYPPETITLSSLAVLAYLVSAQVAYRLTSARPGRSRFWTAPVLGPRIGSYLTYGILLSSTHMTVAQFTNWIPFELHSVLRAAFFGVGVLCTFVTMQRWGRNELRAGEKWLFSVPFFFQLIVMASGLVMISSITLLGIAMLGYLSGGRKFPWVAAVALFLLIAILHNGKVAMRGLYWGGDKAPPTFTQLPGYYFEWLSYGVSTPLIGTPADEESKSASAKLVERASLMHMLALVVHVTPEHQPFLYGETYRFVLPQLIPRLFWPQKPPSHIATYRLAIYYGLQTEESTRTTTIAFGMPAEAYANFGLLGMAGFGAFLGYAFKTLRMLSINSPMFSLAGLMMIILTAWSLSAEQTLAAWVSSLFQALLMTLGVPWVLHQLFGE